ncbi:MAG: phosphate ABC transporter substrate-binding protein [Gemmatimonadota bacterium]
MKPLLLVACVGLLLLHARPARAQEGFRIIVNSANPVSVLKNGDASKLFLRKQGKWASGQPVQPVDQVESSAVRRAFSQAVNGMDVPSVKSYWQEIVFSGKGEPPVEKPSDADVIAYIKANPDGIGYVSAAAAASAGVKVVALTQ